MIKIWKSGQFYNNVSYSTEIQNRGQKDKKILSEMSRTTFFLQTCLLKHEMALSTDGTESVCGENAFPPLLFTLYFT